MDMFKGWVDSVQSDPGFAMAHSVSYGWCNNIYTSHNKFQPFSPQTPQLLSG